MFVSFFKYLKNKTFVVLQLTFFFLHCLILRFCSLENCCLRFFCNKIISSQQLLVCCRVDTFVVVVVVVLVVVVVVVVGGVVVVVVVDVVSVEVIVNSIVVYSVVVGSVSSCSSYEKCINLFIFNHFQIEFSEL